MNKYNLYQGDCVEVLSLIEQESIDLVVTSPPYNVSKEYENKLSETEYKDFSLQWLKECHRVLKPDGRICVNIPFCMNDKGKTFYILPLILEAFKEAGFHYRHLIVWDQLNAGCETAWGSWKSVSSPWIRHMTEFILVGYKNQWKKLESGVSDINEKEFMIYTNDKWKMNTESAKKIGHPAPYPEELVYRCIKLFSYVDDVVLDPFLGSGTTMKVCQENRRSCVGIEMFEDYIPLIKTRCWGRQFLDRQVKYEFMIVVSKEKTTQDKHRKRSK